MLCVCPPSLSGEGKMQINLHYYLRRRLASEGIVTFAVTLGVCPPSLGGEGHALYSVLWQFLVDLSRKITDRSGDDREGSSLFQHILVLLRRFNSVLSQDSFV